MIAKFILILSVICFFLAIIGIFAPKTAFFLKNKTRLRACFSWFGICILLIIFSWVITPESEKQKIAEEMAAKNAQAQIEKKKAVALSEKPEVQLPDYQCTIASQMKNIKLSLDCVIQKPVEKEALIKLGQKVYKDNDGKNYERVFIMWYLPHYKIDAGAWGTTNFEKGHSSTSILRIQGE